MSSSAPDEPAPSPASSSEVEVVDIATLPTADEFFGDKQADTAAPAPPAAPAQAGAPAVSATADAMEAETVLTPGSDRVGAAKPDLPPVGLVRLRRQPSETILCAQPGYEDAEDDDDGEVSRRATTEVLSWGRGEEGQLMLAEPTNSDVYVQHSRAFLLAVRLVAVVCCGLTPLFGVCRPTVVAKFKTHRMVDVAMSVFHTLSVTENGAVYASGSNDEGQIVSNEVGVVPLPDRCSPATHRV